MFKRRNKKPDSPKQIPDKTPCHGCGTDKVDYYTNQHGIIAGYWQCRSCHETALARESRDFFRIKYGG